VAIGWNPPFFGQRSICCPAEFACSIRQNCLVAADFAEVDAVAPLLQLFTR
jgi:hypothetical protein